MDSAKIYDYLALRRRVFDWVRPLSAEQYAHEFPFGLGTLGRTLTHILASEWYYVERIEQHEVPPYDQWPIQHEKPPPFSELVAAWTEQTARTRAAITGVSNWGAEFEYPVVHDGRPIVITASAADIFTQLALHEVHHRAQAMSMLRQLGVPAEEIDFNLLMYKRRDASR